MSEVVLSIKNANIYQGDSLILSDVNITVSKVNSFTWWVKLEQENPVYSRPFMASCF